MKIFDEIVLRGADRDMMESEDEFTGLFEADIEMEEDNYPVDETLDISDQDNEERSSMAINNRLFNASFKIHQLQETKCGVTTYCGTEAEADFISRWNNRKRKNNTVTRSEPERWGDRLKNDAADLKKYKVQESLRRESECEWVKKDIYDYLHAQTKRKISEPSLLISVAHNKIWFLLYDGLLPSGSYIHIGDIFTGNKKEFLVVIENDFLKKFKKQAESRFIDIANFYVLIKYPPNKNSYSWDKIKMKIFKKGPKSLEFETELLVSEFLMIK